MDIGLTAIFNIRFNFSLNEKESLIHGDSEIQERASKLLMF